LKGKGSFLVMVFSVVGLVLWTSMFANVMTAMDALRTHTNIATFTALLTIILIAPVVLLVGGVFAASFGYYKGYQGAQAQDASGILRMVFGIVQIILFISLFGTIMTSFYQLSIGGATANASFSPAEYTAFGTVVTIAPVVLFLAGIFGGVATGVSGYRARRRGRRALLS